MINFNMSLFEDIISDDEHFESNLTTGKPLTIKWGADPSAPDLQDNHRRKLASPSRRKFL